VHVQAHLLHGIGNVGLRHRQATVGMCIINGRAIGWQLAFGLDRRGDGLSVHHAHTLADLLGIPVLGQIEAVLCAFDVDAEEEVEGAHVSDGELGMKAVDDGAKESGAGAGEHYVIDIE
jgi:hypothetical protein